MIKYYKSNTEGIVEKHTIELVDISVLKMKKSELEASLAVADEPMTQAEIDLENQMRVDRKQSIQAEVDELQDKITALESVQDPAPKPIGE